MAAVFERWLCARFVESQALEEVSDVDAELARDLEDAAGADPIGAGLVLLHLLVGHLECLGQLFLGQAELGAPCPNPLADMLVDALGPAHLHPCRG